MTYSRQEAAREAISAATDLRLTYGLSTWEPVRVFDVCDSAGITVRFVNISMEGLYIRSRPPEIWLSAQRPLARRAFNCAHELGHHVFGHASTIDQILNTERTSPKSREEFLADAFAGSLLMSEVGIRRSINRRGIEISKLTPVQAFTLSSYFGVGYTTLVSHLAYAEGLISRNHADNLLRYSTKEIREGITGLSDTQPLVVVDTHWESATVDCEVKSRIQVPPDVTFNQTSTTLAWLKPGLLIANRPGVVQLTAPRNWAIFVRVSKEGYVGISTYRHLEDDE